MVENFLHYIHFQVPEFQGIVLSNLNNVAVQLDLCLCTVKEENYSDIIKIELLKLFRYY